MAVVFAEQELHNACQVLFGSELQISHGFLDYLQLSGIKSAYRKKAFETHPDRLPRESIMNGAGDLFMAVQQAYESLNSFIDARKKGYILQSNGSGISNLRPENKKPRPTSRHRKRQARPEHPFNRKTKQKTSFWSAQQNSTAARPGTLHKGPIPERELLFGHYLYYSGLVNWQTIIKALVWQRSRRPRIGEIGCSYGWLTSKDILHILKSRSLTDPFGKSAVEQGFLTDNQLRLLVFQQKRLQKKFGEYFLENNLITARQMNLLIRQFKTHNYAAASSKSKYRTM